MLFVQAVFPILLLCFKDLYHSPPLLWTPSSVLPSEDGKFELNFGRGGTRARAPWEDIGMSPAAAREPLTASFVQPSVFCKHLFLSSVFFGQRKVLSSMHEYFSVSVSDSGEKSLSFLFLQVPPSGLRWCLRGAI